MTTSTYKYTIYMVEIHYHPAGKEKIGYEKVLTREFHTKPFCDAKRFRKNARITSIDIFKFESDNKENFTEEKLHLCENTEIVKQIYFGDVKKVGDLSLQELKKYDYLGCWTYIVKMM